MFAFRDLTEERAVDQLKNDFVSTVSHELRTPLAAIYGAARTLLRSDIELRDEQRGTLLGGDRQRVRPARPDGQRHPVGQPSRLGQPPDQRRKLRRERAGARGRRGRAGAPARTDDARRLGHRAAAADQRRPGQDPPGRSRTWSRTQSSTRPTEAWSRSGPSSGTASSVFSVRDEGLGIAPGEQRRVFEKFYRVDPNLSRGIGGTGLGLYICRELVRAHGGPDLGRLPRGRRLDLLLRATGGDAGELKGKGAARRRPLRADLVRRPGCRAVLDVRRPAAAHAARAAPRRPEDHREHEPDDARRPAGSSPPSACRCPVTSALTAKARIAPNAIKKMLTPIPTFRSSLGFMVPAHGLPGCGVAETFQPLRLRSGMRFD